MLSISLAERSPNVNPYVSRIASLDRIQFALPQKILDTVSRTK